MVHGGQELEHGEDDAAVDQDGLHHAALVQRQTAWGCLLLVTRGPGGRGLGAVLGKINISSGICEMKINNGLSFISCISRVPNIFLNVEMLISGKLEKHLGY